MMIAVCTFHRVDFRYDCGGRSIFCSDLNCNNCSFFSVSQLPNGVNGLGAPMANLTAQSIATQQGNQLLGVAKGANAVWGRKPEPAPVLAPTPASPAPAQHQAAVLNSPPGPYGNNNTSSSASVSSVASPYSEPQPQVPAAPRELTEKEKQAAALFGGLGGSTTATGRAAKPVVRRTPARGSVTAAQEPAAAVAAPADELLAPHVEAVEHVHAPQAQAAAPSLLDMDLLDVHHHAPTPVAMPPTPPPQFTPAPAPAPAPAPVPVASPAPVPAAMVNSISSAFADLMNPEQSPASAPVAEPTANVMPLKIITAEFGKRWGSTPFDVKQSVTVANLSTLEQLRRAVPPSYHHVESIPASLEAIFAATLTSTGSVILLHVKLQPGRRAVDIVVKSNAKEICAKEGAFLASALVSFQG